MCTILYLYRVHPEFPLIVAANRDEYYARPARPPGVLGAAPRVLAGQDLRAGGTWMGANEHGLFVGLTNQRSFRAPDPDAPSRGEVVRRALEARDVEQVIGQLRALEPRRYNPFNLLFGHAQRLMAAYVRPDQHRVEIEEAPEGVAVLPNDRIGARGFPKAERAIRMADRLAGEAWPSLARRLATVLADHELADPAALPTPPAGSSFTRERLHQHSAICTHTERYGTCSASLIALTAGRVHSYLYADGPPCRARFEEHVQLLG
ncbi:MAG: NRDE family protein [Myxococcales bacterium]|nr:NRDE family protein [Myxococcales bacterium]